MQKLRKFLQEGLTTKQARNGRYSLRAYARDLGVNATSLSLFMRGKRAFTVGTARQVEERLRVLFPSETLPPAVDADATQYTVVELDALEVIADWYHFAILSLLELDDFDATSDAIAARLNLPAATVELATLRLLRLGMVVRNDAGRLTVTGRSFTTPDKISHAVLRKPHYQALALAKESLDRDGIDQRDFTGMTMAVDPARLPEAKQRIKRFNRKLCAFLEGGEKKEVYRLCVQLFPLSR